MNTDQRRIRQKNYVKRHLGVLVISGIIFMLGLLFGEHVPFLISGHPSNGFFIGIFYALFLVSYFLIFVLMILPTYPWRDNS